MKKKIAILGSTGSIGTQALQVIEEHSDLYEAYVLTANNRVDELIEQARKFKPEAVVIANDAKYNQLKEALADLPIKVYGGEEALCQIVTDDNIDMVLTAMVGYAGLKPTMNAIRARKAIALANKETLVVAGELVNELAQQYGTPILPVDSEHSAVFQCLAGEIGNPIDKVILTASGGPFRTYSLEQLATVTKAQALKHPNWDMGAKITIDSASMMIQRFRSNRGQMALRCATRADRGSGASAKHHTLHGAIRRQFNQGTTRFTRYASAHPVCILLSRPLVCIIPTIGFQDLHATHLRATRHQALPQFGISLRSLASRRKHALHHQCRQRSGCIGLLERPHLLPWHERCDREMYATGFFHRKANLRRLCSHR